MPASEAASRMRSTDWTPALCPLMRGHPRCAAHRPLPSMMIATWAGTVIACLEAGGAGEVRVAGLAYARRAYRDDDGDVRRDGHRAGNLVNVKKIMLARDLPLRWGRPRAPVPPC